MHEKGFLWTHHCLLSSTFSRKVLLGVFFSGKKKRCLSKILIWTSSQQSELGAFQVEQSKVLIKEGGVQLTLTIVDTPGFGDAVDNSNWWAPLARSHSPNDHTLFIIQFPHQSHPVFAVTCLSSWQPVINYIDSKCEDFLNAESRVNRRSMPDNRVHCCLYFIAPSGHGYVCIGRKMWSSAFDVFSVFGQTNSLFASHVCGKSDVRVGVMTFSITLP